MKSHKRNSSWWSETGKILVSEIKNETEMIIYEQYYINKYNPIYNSKDKRYDDVSELNFKELKFTWEYDKELMILR
jgi:excinuclease UvrABC nuclease subunit